MRVDLIELVPVPADGAARCRRVAERRHRRNYLVSASGLVALVVLVSVTMTVRRSGRLDTAGPGAVPATVAPAPPPIADDGSPFPVPPAALAARPPIPPGWRTVAFGLVEFAVPGDWIVLETAERPSLCGTEAGTAIAAQGRPVVSLGGGVVGPPPPGDPAGGVCLPVPRSLQVYAQRSDCPTTNDPCRTTAVNGLTVRRSATTVTVAELDVDLFFGGLDADTVTAVVATLVPSPRARVLAAGPVLDTTGWTRSSIGDLEMLTPPAWPTHDLGTTEPVPGACGGGVFAPHPQTLLTGRAAMPACPARSPEYPQAVRTDGAWLYQLQAIGGIPLGDLPRFTTHGNEPFRRGVGLLNLDRTDSVGLLVVTSAGTVVVTVGIGADDTVARTIIHGLTLGGAPIGALPRR
jgi:hypothetical protein